MIVRAPHILISFVTNLCRGVLCAAKKWEMDSRHEYMPLIYHPPPPLSIYSSEILLLSSPPSYRNTMLAPRKQLYQNIGAFSAAKKGMLHTKITLIKYKHYKITNLKLNNKTNHLIKRLLHDGSKHYLKKTQKSNFGKYSKNLPFILLS